jgi:hypothetical protein
MIIIKQNSFLHGMDFIQHNMRTKFDIYVFITIAGSLPLLVDYWSPRVSSAQQSVLRHIHGLLDIFFIEINSSYIMYFFFIKPKVLLPQK